MQDLSEDMKKDAIWKAIQKDVDKYPALGDITKSTNKKSELIEKYETVVSAAEEVAEEVAEEAAGEAAEAGAAEQSGEEDDIDPDAVFERFLKEAPEAVITPRTQMILRLQNPEAPSMEFEVKGVDGELGMKMLSLEDVTRTWRTPEEDLEAPQEPRVALTPLSEVPEWAREQVINLVESGDLALYPTVEDANESENGEPNREALLDSNVGELSMEVVYAKNTGAKNPPMLVEPTGKFDNPEQEAAWNVVNGMVEGQGPLPDRREDVSTDSSTITRAEYMHVKDRIERCLERPQPFTERATNPKLFDERMFFNQLLQIENGGFTPQRSSLTKQGGVRKSILRLIREKAKAAGFEMMGDYVVKKQDRSDFSAQMPEREFTQNRQPDLPFHTDIGQRAPADDWR